MATLYIWPGATFNGDGTLPTQATIDGGAGAYNTFPTLTANNTYKVKRETYFSRLTGVRPQSQTSAATTPLTITTYYNDDGTDDTTKAKPIIDNLGGSPGIGAVFIDTCTNVRVENIVGTNSNASAGAGVAIRRSVGVTVTNCEGFNNTHGFRVTQDQASGTSVTTDITVTGGTWKNNLGSGIYIEWGAASTANIRRLTVTYNEVYNNGLGSSASSRGGIVCSNQRATGAGNADSDSADYSIYDLVIENNTSHGNRSYGILAYAVRNDRKTSSISYNHVYGNGYSMDIDTHSLWVGCPYDTIIQQNYVHSNYGWVGGTVGSGVGIFIDYNAASAVGGSGAKVRSNVVTDQWTGSTTSSLPGAGIHVLANTNVIVESNVVLRCRTGISVTGSPATTSNGCQVLNNTIYDILGTQNGPTTFSGYGVAIDAGNNVIVKNNVIYNARIGLYLYSSLTGFVEQNNSFYAITGINKISGTTFANAVSVAIDASDLTSNPLLDSNGRFVTTSSPLYQAGQFLGYSVDVNNVQRRKPCNIGAYEYYSSRAVRA